MTVTAELNQKPKAILIRELGPVDYTPFIQKFEEGSGDYTAYCHQWLGEQCAWILHEQASQLCIPMDSYGQSEQNWSTQRIEIAGASLRKSICKFRHHSFIPILSDYCAHDPE